MLKTFLNLSQEQLEPSSHHTAGAQWAQSLRWMSEPLGPSLWFLSCWQALALVLCPAFFITWTDTCTAPPQKDAKRNWNSAPERGDDLAAGQLSAAPGHSVAGCRMGWLWRETAGTGSPSGGQESSTFPSSPGAAGRHWTAKLDFSVCQTLQRKGFWSLEVGAGQ